MLLQKVIGGSIYGQKMFSTKSIYLPDITIAAGSGVQHPGIFQLIKTSDKLQAQNKCYTV
jgi:hypothetical protein